MKCKLPLIALAITILLLVAASAVRAQEEPPAPYAGLKNPFPWSDVPALEAGERIYRQSCLGCHGANGASLAQSDFSTVEFAERLEERPDFYFWVLSEGRLDRGMPPFQSSLSEEKRWQVLTYLRSLGAVAAPSEESQPPAPPPPEGEGDSLLLTAPEHAQSGQPLVLTALLRDSQGNPISNATVSFFIEVDFFASGLMEIGQAVTNDKGKATLETALRQVGDTPVVARYQGIESTTAVTLAEADGPFYRAETGLDTPGNAIVLGPRSARELTEDGTAPMTALRIPGGLRAVPLLAYVFTLILVWSLYLRIMYQLFRIPVVSQIGDTDTRLVPMIGMAVMVAFVTLLVLILITGPYSHFHFPGT